jgi:tetratricopeptide (TPR) repeat protein
MKKKASPAAPKPPFHWRRLLPFAALWALTLAAYSNSFQTGLIFDNSAIILKDTRVRAASPENLSLILTKEYWYPPTGNGLYRPLATLSYLFNYAVLGDGASPAGYHLVNYALHSLNASLVFLLALLLFGETLPAFAMAALWAVHPVLTESVTNVIGRADLLSAFGVLAALLCFARGREAPGRKRIAWLIAAGLAAAVGIFSKESAIIVIGAVPLFDFAFPKRQTLRRRLIAYAAVALPCVVFLLARHAVLAGSPAMQIPFTDNPISGAGFWSARLTAIGVIGRQFALLVWPMRLSADYSYNAIPIANGLDGPVLAGLAVLLDAAALALWGYRRDRKIFFLIVFAAGALLPTSNLLFPIGTIMAERFLYLPAIAFAGCFVAALWALRARIPGVWIKAAFAAMALLFAARTFARNYDWATEDSLWTSAEAAVPDSFRAHMSLAEGDFDKAIRETDRTLAILNPLRDDRNSPIPYINAGKVYSDKGDSLAPAEGDRWARKALDVLQRAERIQSALNDRGHREAVAQGKPFHPTQFSSLDQQLAHVYLRLSRFDEAAAALKRAMRVRLAPEMFTGLSTAYLGINDVRAAEIALLEGTIWRRQDSSIATQLIAVYSAKDANSCALIPSPNNSYRLNTNCPLVQTELCAASRDLTPLLESQGQTAEASRVRTGAQHAGCVQ